MARPYSAPDIDIGYRVSGSGGDHILHVRIQRVRPGKRLRHFLVYRIIIAGFVKIIGKAFVKYAVFFKRVEVFGGISGRHKARNPGMFRKIFGGLFRHGIGVIVLRTHGRRKTSVQPVAERIFIRFFIRHRAFEPINAVSRVERRLFGYGEVPNGYFNGNNAFFAPVGFESHFTSVYTRSLVFCAPNGYPEALICICFNVYAVQVGAVAVYRNENIGIISHSLQRLIFGISRRAINIMLIVYGNVFYLFRASVKNKIGHGNADVRLRLFGFIHKLHTLSLVFCKGCRHHRFGR